MARTRSDSAAAQASILLIDDNSLGLAARKVLLEELGHRVTTTATASEATSLLAKQKFDLVITDFKMPQMTGADLIGWMRERELDTPVILISGFVDTLGLRADNTGADAVIQKSAHEISHMLRAVRALLRQGASRKPPGRQASRKPRTKAASS